MPLESIQILDPSRGRPSMLPKVSLNLAAPKKSGDINAEIIKAQKPKEKITPRVLFNGRNPRQLLYSEREKDAEDTAYVGEAQRAHNKRVSSNPTSGAVDSRPTSFEEELRLNPPPEYSLPIGYEDEEDSATGVLPEKGAYDFDAPLPDEPSKKLMSTNPTRKLTTP